MELSDIFLRSVDLGPSISVHFVRDDSYGRIAFLEQNLVVSGGRLTRA